MNQGFFSQNILRSSISFDLVDGVPKANKSKNKTFQDPKSTFEMNQPEAMTWWPGVCCNSVLTNNRQLLTKS